MSVPRWRKAVPPLLSLIIRRIALRRDAIGSRAGFQGREVPPIPPQSECDETRTPRSSAAMAQFTGQTLRDNGYDRKLFIFVHSLPLKCKNCREKKKNPRYRRCSAETPPPLSPPRPKRRRFMQVYNQVLFCSNSIQKHCECILLIIRSEVGGRRRRRRRPRKRGTTFSASARTDNHPNHP